MVAKSRDGSSSTAAVPRAITLADCGSIKEPSEVHISHNGKFIAYLYNYKLYMLPADEGKRPKLLAPAEFYAGSLAWSRDDKWIYCLAKYPYGTGQETQLWKVSAKGTGEPIPVAHRAGGITANKLSPDENFLLLELEHSGIDAPAPSNDAEPTPFVTDGLYFKKDRIGYVAQKAKTNIYVFNISSGALTQVTNTDHFDREPCWSPDGSKIAFVREVETGNGYHSNLYMTSWQESQPGVAKQLSHSPALRRSPTWSADGKLIAYLSSDEQHGPLAVNHLAVCSIADGKEEILTEELDRTIVSFYFSPNGRSIDVLYANEGGQNLARIRLRDKQVKRLIDGNFYVSSSSTSDDGFLALNMKGINDSSDIFTMKGGRPKRLTDFNRTFFDERILATKESQSTKIRTGIRIQAFVTKPAGFDPNKKYPAVLRIHGGPVAQAKCGYDFMPQFLAANGYVVVEPNPPGSLGRGQKYTSEIYQNWGNNKYPDVVRLIDHMIGLGYIDPEKLAVMGYSYGGYMTNCVITQTPKKFKAAASGAGHSLIAANYGHDVWLKWYNWELGFPWNNRALYEKLSPLNKVHKVKTPTIFLGGAQDWNVPPLNLELMYQSLRIRDVATQLVVYPATGHVGWSSEFAKDYYQRVLDWFDRHVK